MTSQNVSNFLGLNRPSSNLQKYRESFAIRRSLSTDMTSILDNEPEFVFPCVRSLVKQFNRLVDGECNKSEYKCDPSGRECISSDYKCNTSGSECISSEYKCDTSVNECNKSYPSYDCHCVYLNHRITSSAIPDFTRMAENYKGESCSPDNILQQSENAANLLKLKLLNLQYPQKTNFDNSFSTGKWETKDDDNVNILTKERLRRLDSSGDVFVDRNHLYRYWSRESLNAGQSLSSQEYVSPATSSKSDSMDNLVNIARSSSCNHMLGTESPWGRSNSSDSAVVIEDGTSPSESISPLPTSNSRITPNNSTNRLNYSNIESKYNDELPVHLRNSNNFSCGTGTGTINTVQMAARPPSVVISDHSGGSISVHVALAADGFSLNNVLNSYSDYYLNDGYVCPRKVSECSTCSSVSTIDMNSSALHKTSFDYNIAEWKSRSNSRRNSDCSSCYMTGSDEEIEVILQKPSPPPIRKGRASSNWRKVRNVVQWTPFIQTYKRHKYPWVQLAGHQGNFRAGHKQGTIMKKLCPAEEKAFDSLMKDVLKPHVPEYTGVVDGSDNEKYLQLQDLLSGFSAACVMDIKMGVRTYLEEELAKARIKPKLRKDMYEKMVQIDVKAPTEAEHRAKAVTKPRYMVWRETISSTATLGFRIEGVRRGDGNSSKDYKTTKTRDQVSNVILGFVKGYPSVMGKYIERLKEIRETLKKSTFFKTHELIGSSLLFVHNDDKCGVWLIDFAKTIPLPPDVTIGHEEPWIEGTHEDGYLIGFDNLVDLMEKSRLDDQEPLHDTPEDSSSSSATTTDIIPQDPNHADSQQDR